MLSLDNLVNMIFTALISLVSVYIGFKSANMSDKTNTARKMMEDVYSPIFPLIEKDLFRSVTHDIALDYASKISDILDKNPLYVYPSVKLYAEALKISTKDNYQNIFHTFCTTLNKHYDKSSKRIGLPLRSYSYRINTGQFETRLKLAFYVFMLKLPEFFLLLAMFILYIISRSA